MLTMFRGAALSKLPQSVLVASTKATHHYGVGSWKVYDEELDLGEKTKVRRDGTTGVESFTWYIDIGEDLLRDQVIRFPFYRSVDADYRPSDLVFEDNLYQSKDKLPPRHKSKGEHISVNCALISDFREVDTSKFIEKIDRKEISSKCCSSIPEWLKSDTLLAIMFIMTWLSDWIQLL